MVLGARLGAAIAECAVTSIDLVRDSMELEVQCVQQRPLPDRVPRMIGRVGQS